MQQLFITQVKNGWVVRTSVDLYTTVTGDCYVYRTIDELQQALPELLKNSVVPNATIVNPETIKTTAL